MNLDPLIPISPETKKRNYSNWLKEYMVYAEHSEAPDIFHFWTGVSVIAGALRRQVWIDMGYFQWVPNFYIIFVAPPGVVSKSTTANIGMNLLRDIDGVHFGPDAVTWQALVQSMGNSAEMVPMPDGTYMPMSAITIVSSEFGTFLNPHDREMIDALTHLWDGQVSEFKKDTKTQGSDKIVNPWINLLAATTPAWIAGNFPEYMVGGGFTSRCILVYADKKRKLVPYPADELPPDFEDRRKKLIHDLEIISTIRGPYILSKEAKEFGENWYRKHWDNPPKHLQEEAFGGYVARKQTHIHKLAIVLAAAQRSERIILPEDLDAADQLVTELEQDMTRVFGGIGRTQEVRFSGELIEALERYGKPISNNNLYRLLFRRMTYNDYELAIKSAVQAGHIIIQSDGKQLMIRLVKDGE